MSKHKKTRGKFDQAREYEHWLKYETISKLIGINSLCLLVPFSRENIIRALGKPDGHSLNSLRLEYWDGMDGSVRQLAARVTGRVIWSLSDTVCILKHVAKYHIAEIFPPLDVRDELSTDRRWEIAKTVMYMFIGCGDKG